MQTLTLTPVASSTDGQVLTNTRGELIYVVTTPSDIEGVRGTALEITQRAANVSLSQDMVSIVDHNERRAVPFKTFQQGAPATDLCQSTGGDFDGFLNWLSDTEEEAGYAHVPYDCPATNYLRDCTGVDVECFYGHTFVDDKQFTNPAWLAHVLITIDNASSGQKVFASTLLRQLSLR